MKAHLFLDSEEIVIENVNLGKGLKGTWCYKDSTVEFPIGCVPIAFFLKERLPHLKQKLNGFIFVEYNGVCVFITLDISKFESPALAQECIHLQTEQIRNIDGIFTCDLTGNIALPQSEEMRNLAWEEL